MNMKKAGKIISIGVYAVGAAMVLCLGAAALFGSTETAFPDAMLPLSWREVAFSWLVWGTIPMLSACGAVYSFCDIKDSQHKRRNFWLIFLPGFICLVCALSIIGLWIVGQILMGIRGV